MHPLGRFRPRDQCALNFVPSQTMIKTVHKVLRVSMSIYILSLVCGTGLLFKYNNGPSGNKQDIIALLTDGEDANEGEESSKGQKRFNSRPMMEDDDDSARDLFTEIEFGTITYHATNEWVWSFYLAHQLDTATPPPWC